jgi:hypothetical protein
MVTINGLPTRREWKHIARLQRSVNVCLPCALPPADPTTWAGKHGKRDARRAARMTQALNHRIAGHTALTGNWCVAGSPWLSLFTRPLAVDITRAHVTTTTGITATSAA